MYCAFQLRTFHIYFCRTINQDEEVINDENRARGASDLVQMAKVLVSDEYHQQPGISATCKNENSFSQSTKRVHNWFSLIYSFLVIKILWKKLI